MIFFWCSGLEEARHEEIACQGTIAVFVCERTKHMVQNNGRQSALSFFFMYLNDYTLVDNELFGNSCWGFVLNFFDTFFALLTTGDLSEGVLTIRPIFPIK